MIDGGDEGGGLYLGVEIGGSKLQVFAGNRRAQIVERIRLDADSSSGAVGIRSQLERAITELFRTLQTRRHRHWLWRPGGLENRQDLLFSPGRRLVGFSPGGLAFKFDGHPSFC